ncbi:MAG: hypothetical protein HKO59_03685 [Phycisphaerales bacterium]|nr:hypothetical protein [Phycisphaerae bacterium]NNF44247.1 hypothetical protein [Phycisphaerales bacterium]NNM25083.1 hypothetical protein [Phycisphaerales bacterium]
MIIRGLALGVCTLMLAACSGGRTTLDVELRERLSAAPVPDASIRVRGLHFFLPIHPYGIVDPFAGADAEARTDEMGRARFSAPGPPWEIVVTPRDDTPRTLSLDETPSPDRWLRLPGDLELRIDSP